MSDDKNIGIIKNLFGQENTFTTPRLLVLLTKSHTCALLLNQIIFWSSKKSDGWFYKSYDEWLQELLLTKKQVMAYAKKLEDMGVIERKLKKVKGAPYCWYKAIDREIIGLLQKVTMESDKKSQTGKVTKGNKPYTEDYITEDYLHKEKIKNKKEIKNKEKSPPPSAVDSQNMLKCTVEKKEEKKMLDPSYSYPDTYFQESPQEPSSDLVLSYVSGLSVDQQKKEFDIPIGLEQSLTIAQGQVSTSIVTTQDIVNALCWWMMYPVKQNYRKWLASWFAEGCHTKHQELVIILGEQLEKDQRMKDGYVPNPSSYILDARYEDKIYDPKKLKVVSHNDTSWADESKRSIFETW